MADKKCQINYARWRCAAHDAELRDDGTCPAVKRSVLAPKKRKK